MTTHPLILPAPLFVSHISNEEILSTGGSINTKTWKCLPSYGAPMDTYVYFVLKKGDKDKVAEALSKTHDIEPAWECLSGRESSEWCKDQQVITS